ncbi:MAG TPA: flagellar biosynthesis protein FlhA [Pyrinomonadaceae bacterium]|jgi:type III secretion protein V
MNVNKLSGWLPQSLRGGGMTALLARNKDLLLPVGLVLAIGTFFVQIPTWLISILLLLNLAFAVVILSRSLYLKTPLEFTAYPTLLLLTTILRLCLSVSVMRSVLLKGHAGEVIETIGRISAGDVVIVGGVMFLAILVVQFIVVAKGSERVAEVAARFTLDAMPGKQMSIDADLRSGLIPQDEARRRRSALTRESQLYGAMDGAMKFVKGDSIATIIIAFINIFAGFAIGVYNRGMTLGEAAHHYTILTIGDGLAASISSILITVSAGIIVTRVTTEEDDDNISSDIGKQLFTNPKPLFIAAALMLLLGLIPSMPNILLLIIGGALAAAGFFLYRAQQRAAIEEAEHLAKLGETKGDDPLQFSATVPLAIVVGEGLAPLVDPNTPEGARFRASLPRLRHAIYYDLGVLLPYIHVNSATGESNLKPDEYVIALKEIPVDRGKIRPECVFVNDSARNLEPFLIEGEEVLNPADLKPGAWIPAEQRYKAEAANLKIWEPAEVITLHMSNLMKRFAYQFIGIQEAQSMLEYLSRSGMARTVEEVIPTPISLTVFADVLRRLVQEGISIRDMKSILDALSAWARVESEDPAYLTEYVRISLSRHVTFTYTRGRDVLFVYKLDQEIEDIIHGSLQPDSKQRKAIMNLDPDLAEDIVAAIRREIPEPLPSAQKPVILTHFNLRRFVRKIVEVEFPLLAVISYAEIPPDVHVQVLNNIAIRPPQSLLGGGDEDDFDFDEEDREELAASGYRALSDDF